MVQFTDHVEWGLAPARVASGVGAACGPLPFNPLAFATSGLPLRVRSATSASRAIGASSPRPCAPTSSSRSATPTTPARSTPRSRRFSPPASSPTCTSTAKAAPSSSTVVENPVINTVAFEGNSEVDTDTLKDEVQLKPRSVFTRAKVQADVQRILDVYRRQGRFAASVEPKIIELEQSRVNLVFEINEGGATKVKGINFTGNHAFTDSQLRDIISTTQIGLVRLPQGHERLRSGSHEPRSRAAAPVLSQERLRRRARRRRPTPSSTATAPASSSTSRSRKASSTSSARSRSRARFPASIRTRSSARLLTDQGETYNGTDIDKTLEKLTLVSGRAGLRVLPASARAPRPIRRRAPSRSSTSSTKARASTSSASTSSATSARRTTSSGASSDCGRRRLQSAAGRPRQEAPADARLLQGRRSQAPSRLRSRSRRPRRRARRAVHRRAVVRRRLLDGGRRHRRREHHASATCSATASSCASSSAARFERLQVDLSFTEPRFLDRNLSAGFDLFHKEVDQTDESGFEPTARAARCASASRCPRTSGCRRAIRSTTAASSR